MDARAERTAAAMHKTILMLAETDVVTELTVAQVATAVGINRVTFYNHAASPAELLMAALRPELDGIRRQFLHPQSPLRNQSDTITRAVGEHIVARHAIYRRNLPANGHGFLADYLADHFAESARIMLSTHPLIMTRVPGASMLSADASERATAQFIAHGTIGAIAAWVHTPVPLQPGQIVDLIQGLLPPWWVEAIGTPLDGTPPSAP